MKYLKTFRSLIAIAASTFVVGSVAMAQPTSNVFLSVKNNGAGVDLAQDTVRFGVNPAATNSGFDAALGEEEQPPAPPGGVFDLRFTSLGSTTGGSTGLGEGVKKNYHVSTGSATQRDTFQIRIQPGDGGFPVTLYWNNNMNQYFGSATLRYVDQDGNAQLVNMLTSSSVAFTGDATPTNVRIFTLNPMAPAAGVNASLSAPFGTVSLPPGTASRTLTVSNAGAGAETINNITLAGPRFSLGGAPVFPQALPGNGSSNFTINFSAVAVGTYRDTIVITHSGPGLPIRIAVEANVSAGEGIYFLDVINRVMDNRAGLYSEIIGLKYSGSTPAQGLQFKITLPSSFVQITSIETGPDLPGGPWSFDYELTNAASGGEAIVILYGQNTTVNFPAGQYDSLFRVRYNTVNISTCNGGVGGDSVAALAYLSNVESSLANDLGTPAGISTDPDRDTTRFFVHNTSARGDVNCDDRVDVLDILTIVDHILGRITLQTWQINRADLAPWSAVWATGVIFDDANNYGDTKVNVQDVTLIANAILNEEWPDNLQLFGAEEGGDKGEGNTILGAGVYDVKLVYNIMRNGINVDMQNLVPVKGIQMKIKASDAPADLEAKLASALSERFTLNYKVIDGEVRILIYSLSGDAISAVETAEPLLQLPFAVENPAAVAVITPITVGDVSNRSVKVEYEINSSAASVAGEAAAASFKLTNVPNPTSQTTEIRYTLANAAVVTLVVSDASGREVASLIEGARVAAGDHVVEFNAAGIPSGSYIYTLTVDGVSASQTMVVTK